WRSGSVDRAQPLRRGWRLCQSAIDGGRRTGAPAWPRTAKADRRADHRLGPPLSRGRLSAPANAQPLLPVALFSRSAAAPPGSALRMTRRHLVLFVRAPELGRGKRRLAREIGDIAAVRFERAMLALLLHRLGHDRRWRLRLAVTPDRAVYRRHLWPRGVAV